jgi:NAD(P)-dependent dehydrogenase (short-subunit alcohol dehydrogenase family)
MRPRIVQITKGKRVFLMRKQNDYSSNHQNSERPTPPFPEQNIDPPPGLEKKMEPRPQYLAPRYKGAEKLAGRVALITGGDSGIGRAVCVLYAREGADVAFTYLPQEKEDAEETVAAVENEGRRCLSIEGDLTEYSFCQSAVQKVVSTFGKLDLLVNNAAFQKHVENAEDLSLEQWDRTFKTNIYGYFYLVKASLPHLKAGSSIVNCGSITGITGSAGLLDYASTKGAIHAFTKSLAKNLAQRKIRVNAVAPGPVWTPLNPAERGGEGTKNFGADIPYGRPAQPEEIAPTFVFLASDLDSSFITGEVISILGGEVTSN